MPLTAVDGRLAVVSRGTIIALETLPVVAMSSAACGVVVPIPTFPVLRIENTVASVLDKVDPAALMELA
jgi:hypothetical protein